MKGFNKFDVQHKKHLRLYEKRVDALYAEAVRRAVRIGVGLNGFDRSKPFSFSDHPLTAKKAEQLVGWLQKGLQETIEGGVRAEWSLSNVKNDELVDKFVGGRKLPDAIRNVWYNSNGGAMVAFIERKTKGLTLSDRVWRMSEQFKNEIELGLDLGIRAGRSADKISRDIRLFLQQPSELYRRVRNEMKDDAGNSLWQQSKAMRSYHSGRGVYRSSYKNARRLAVTETNMAYRTADNERWGKLDFVIGQHVILSNNHTLNGKHFVDICDELSGVDENDIRGRYPKGFKFTGWHPLCRCFVVPIMADDDKVEQYFDAKLRGDDVSGFFQDDAVSVMPAEFKQWLDDNSERVERARERGTLPNWIKDNEGKVFKESKGG